ncbi:MAG: hypothetical protein ACOH17_06760 [Cellulomonas sp.]
MSMNWEQVVGVLVRGVSGWAGAWSLVFAARGVLAELAAIPERADDLALTYAGLDLGYVLGDIEHAAKSAPGVAVNLGPVSGGDRGAAARVLDDLLTAAERQVQHLAAADDRPVQDVLAASRVLGGLAAARARIAGGAR